MTHMITPETVINSPRQIANGQGAWTGTVRELFKELYQDATGTALEGLHECLREEGKLPELPEDEAETDETHIFDLDRHAHLLTIEHLRDLLDDPNADIVSHPRST
ncbi:hypothetical protein [Nesterenkonia sp.]|uniref:hypothetical protein n=1 Tax=Nesterenkonia sp. TaxID=704201 RepID=UPI0026063A21|nr:hypothetical protein [Nesterenkonia sp.]